MGDVLCGLLLAQPEAERDERWRARYQSLGVIISSAAEKFAPEAERRRAIARLTHELVRKGCSGSEIKAAIIAEAGRLGIANDTALGIAAAILRGAKHV